MKLTQAEWAFHKVPPTERRACWLWEIERARGANEPPWLKLAEERKTIVLKFLERSFYPVMPILPELAIGRLQFYESGGYHHTTIGMHVFEIDWSVQTKEELMEAFSRWIDSRPSQHTPVKWQPYRPGRPRDYGSNLLDLAILRANKYKPGLALLSPFLSQRKIISMNPQHWANAKARARVAIRANNYKILGGIIP